MSKNCFWGVGWVEGVKGGGNRGGRENGGGKRHGCWGDRRPWGTRPLPGKIMAGAPPPIPPAYPHHYTLRTEHRDRYDLVVQSRPVDFVRVPITSSRGPCVTPAALTRGCDARLSNRGIQISSSLESTTPSSSLLPTSLVISRAGNTPTGTFKDRCVSSHVLRSRAKVSSAGSARRLALFTAGTSVLVQVRQCVVWCRWSMSIMY